MNGHVEETPVNPEDSSSQEKDLESASPPATPAEDAAEVEEIKADSTEADSVGSDPGSSEAEELNIGQEQVLELISYIVVNLVEHPDDVTVDIAQRQGRDIYQVRVHQEDLGKVIGKGGQTARALRVLLMAVSARTDQRIGLEIVE